MTMLTVADKLGLKQLPKPADAAIAPRDDLEPSPALSIIENGPDSLPAARSRACQSGRRWRHSEEISIYHREGRRGDGGHRPEGRWR